MTEQQTLTGTNLTALREAYLETVTETLPARARRRSWPIQDDHCFGRIVLDNLFEDEWYGHVSGTPAYEHLSETELRRALDIAETMMTEGERAVVRLNENSLRWRGELA